MSAVCVLFIVGLEVHMTRKVLLVAKVLSCQRCDRWSSRKTAPVRCQEARTAHKGLFCFYLPSWKQHPPGEFIKGWHHLSQFWVRERKYSARELSLLLVFALCLIFSLVRSNRSLRAHFTAKSKTPPCARLHSCFKLFGCAQTRVFWRSASKVEFKSAWNREVGGSVHECSGAPTARRASTSPRSVAGCVGVCLVLEGGFNLSEHIGQVLQLYSQWPWVSTAFFLGRGWCNLPRLDGWTRFVGSLSCSIGRCSLRTNHSGFCFLSVADISNRRLIKGE